MATKIISILRDYEPQQLSSGEIKMQCPFRHLHDRDSQRRKQMFINTDKNLYHCFSCGSRGAVTGLLTTQFDLSLTDAIELVNFENIDVYLEDYEQKGLLDFSLPELELDHLLSYKVPPEDFLDRGIKYSLLKKFGVGVNKVTHKKFGEVTATTIPLKQHSKLVGVKYRTTYKGKRVFWYSEGFRKDHFLYNIESVDKEGILVEGETDVWRSIQHGKDETFGTLGVEISDFHLLQLHDLDTLYVAYDNDNAGMIGKEKAYHKLKSSIGNILFVPYDASDPGECSKESWLNGLSNSDDYAVYSMEMNRLLGEDYEIIQETAIKQLRKSGWLV